MGRTRDGVLSRLSLAVVALLSVVAVVAVVAAPGGQEAGATVSQIPPNNPPENVPFQLDPYIACSAVNALSTETQCIDVVLHDINYARSLEGVPSMVLPSNFAALAVPEQMEVLVNLERGDRGLSPFSGLSESLSATDNNTFPAAVDPSAPAGYSDNEFASNFAEEANALEADYAWMYDDGYAGSNFDCVVGGSVSGCWVHRDNILGPWNSSSGQTPELGAACASTAGADSCANPAGTPTTLGEYSLSFANETGTADTQDDPYTDATFPTSEVLPQVVVVQPEGTSSTSAGTTVTIEGNYFSLYGGTPTVDFGGVPATGVAVQWDGQLTAVAPAGTGTVTVTVTTPAGTSSSTATPGVNQFSYGAASAPTVASVTADSGPMTGTDPASVVITGTNFEAGGQPTVDFGSTQVEDLNFTSTMITVTDVPAAITAGAVDVTVSTANGTSATGAADTYTYTAVPAPTVTGVTASSGPGVGGTTVTVAGANFDGVSAVSFGGVDVPFSVQSASSLTATSPPGSGTVNVVVTAAGGTTTVSGADQFTYLSLPLPTVAGLNPATGTAAGGTTVTITGTNFSGVTNVAFGATSAPFTVTSTTSISATAPAGATGTVDVTVTTTGGGTSATSAADQYTYTPITTTSTSPPTTTTTTTTLTLPAGHGYWLVGSDGGIFSFGNALFHGSTGNIKLNKPVVGITPTSDKAGYWLVASDGGVFAFGDAGFVGSIPGLGLLPAGSTAPGKHLNAPIVGMVPSANGLGYFLVAADGGVFAFNANFSGSCPGIGGCSGAAVGVAPDASGGGYWLVTATGLVYNFGNAANFGQPGRQSSAITSIVRTPDGGGYWILDANGQVFAYGDAAALGGLPPNTAGGLDPAAAVFTTSDGRGYWVVTALGKVYALGDAPNDGDMSGTHLNGSIIAATGF